VDLRGPMENLSIGSSEGASCNFSGGR
jgi:hypothetical protein